MVRFKHGLRVLLASTAVGVIVLSALAPVAASADDSPPSGFPTWSDVEQAKSSQEAKSAEVDKITSLLASLGAQSEALGTAAVTASGEYAVAKAALDAASAKVDVLAAQTKQARAQADQYKKEAGALAAQSYKTAGANVGIFVALNALESPDGIRQLDLMNAVSAKTTTLYNKSSQVANTIKSLTQQQQAATDVRTKLASDAAKKLAAAEAAKAAMEQQVNTEQAQSQTLVAQLASLKDTTAAVEAKYQQGVAAQAAYEAAQEAKRQAAAAAAAAAAQAAANAAAANQSGGNAPANTQAPLTSGGGSGFIPVAELLPTIPNNGVNNPAGAQAYASSVLGAHGWGQDQFGCLVQLWNQESSWLTNATNQSSGAYGIAQALPPGKYSEAGGDWLTNYRTQINWGLGYIANRYGSPCGAWNHEVSSNWY